MHCRGGIEMVLHDHFHLVPAADANYGSKDWCRVAVRMHRLSFDKGVPTRRGYQIDRVSRCRGIDQPREWQRSRERGGFAVSQPAANNGACRNCATADRKSTTRKHHQRAPSFMLLSDLASGLYTLL